MSNSDNPHTIIHSITEHQLTFRNDPTDPTKSPIRMRRKIPKGKGFLHPYIHPQQIKTIRVESGQMELLIGQNTAIIDQGNEKTLREGTAHDFRNANYDTPLVLSIELKPALHTREAYEVLWSIPTRYRQPDGRLKIGQWLVYQDLYWGIIALPKIATEIQKMTARSLAPMARLLGYRARYWKT